MSLKSGRLAETWPLHYQDVPFGASFGKEIQEKYKENVYVGYRYYETARKAVRYPFGYGLSYTTFDISNLSVQQEEDHVLVSCRVTNTGGRYGGEVVQCYVQAPETELWKPVRELAAFQKVYLEPGESKTVVMQTPLDQLMRYSLKEEKFLLEDGEYCFQIGQNVSKIICKKTIHLAGEKISLSSQDEQVRAIYQKADLEQVSDAEFAKLLGRRIPTELPITMESRFTDLKQTVMGRILFEAVLSVVKSFPYHVAEGVSELANGHLLKGLRCFLRVPKVPKLPKHQRQIPSGAPDRSDWQSAERNLLFSEKLLQHGIPGMLQRFV